jgi:hypothetical protein
MQYRHRNPTEENPMPKPNYQFEKRKREMQKKQKRAEKAERKSSVVLPDPSKNVTVPEEKN